jgi:desulfoferrodoxin (superoxide reductase-like protein)
LRLVSGLTLAGFCPGGRAGLPTAAAEALQQPTAFERLHLPELRLPRVTVNGARVPVVVDLTHPMEADHYIASLQLVNEADPFPSKGIFHFTPANGRAHLAVQVRMHSGEASLLAIAVCNRHGRWAVRQPITIPEGAGGCAAPAGEATARPLDDEIRPPAIRLPEWLAQRSLRRGAIVRVQVQCQHPNRTGLVYWDGRFLAVGEPFYLTAMEVFYGGQLVSRYDMSPGLSDNPLITFMLRLTQAAPLEVVLTNSRGERFQARQELALV